MESAVKCWQVLGVIQGLRVEGLKWTHAMPNFLPTYVHHDSRRVAGTLFNFRPQHSGSIMQNLKCLDCSWEDPRRFSLSAHYSSNFWTLITAVQYVGSTGFATKAIPQSAPLPTEHSKITILHGTGCSLNLSISYDCSFAFWEYGCGLLSMGKQSIGKPCRMSGHPLLQKARTFGLGPPPAPPE